jgi:hypothetical protein
MVDELDVVVNVYKQQNIGGLLDLQAQNSGSLAPAGQLDLTDYFNAIGVFQALSFIQLATKTADAIGNCL